MTVLRLKCVEMFDEEYTVCDDVLNGEDRFQLATNRPDYPFAPGETCATAAPRVSTTVSICRSGNPP